MANCGIACIEWKDGKDVISGEAVVINDETVVAPETALVVEFKR